MDITKISKVEVINTEGTEQNFVRGEETKELGPFKGIACFSTEKSSLSALAMFPAC